MNLNEKCRIICTHPLVNHLSKIAQDKSLLVARAVLGFVFAQAGWGKLHNLDSVIQYFSEIGIPFAHIQAPFVAGLEFVGGLMVAFGFLTRFFSFQLLVTMAVAIATAHWSELEKIEDLFSLSEFLYILIFGILTSFGPGRVSIDYFISKFFCKKH